MCWIRSILIGVLCFVSLTELCPGADRAAARKAYQTAAEYHTWLESQPERSRSLKQYRHSIYLYRRVIDHDPTYGAADDSIFAIATLYDEIWQLFDRSGDRSRAVYYYRFLAREYPATRHRQAALNRASELESVEQVGASVIAASGQSGERQATEVATLSEVRYWSNEDYTRVVLQLDQEVEFEKNILRGPDRVYFDLHSTRMAPSLDDQTYEVNGLFIKRIRVAENRPSVTRVVLDFDQIRNHTVFALYDPFRIVVDTRGHSRQKTDEPSSEERLADRETPDERAASRPAAGEEATEEGAQVVSASPTVQGNWTLTRTLGLKVGRVVIDPGHGGKDSGTVGPSGLLEKDVVLSVALRLRDLLREQLGVDVILTRSDDRFIPLEERTALANQKGADLFISIHANASPNRRASGVETYVLDFATTDAEREIASRENATAQRNVRELEDLLKQIALGDYNQESRELAQIVQRELVAGLSAYDHVQKDRGVKQAPFIVLLGSNMPSILTEIGFISNPNDEEFYGTEDAQEAVAQSLLLGVEAYFRSLGLLPGSRQAAVAASR